jgi:hypothetical protein
MLFKGTMREQENVEEGWDDDAAATKKLGVGLEARGAWKGRRMC